MSLSIMNMKSKQCLSQRERRFNLGKPTHTRTGNYLVHALTINLSPKMIVDVSMLGISCKHTRKKVRQLKWGLMTSLEQYRYFYHVYIPSVVAPLVTEGTFVTETSEDGRIHVHCLLRTDFEDDEMYDEGAMLRDLRLGFVRNRLVHSLVDSLKLKNDDKRMAVYKRLNYVHYLEDVPAWIEYMEKQQVFPPLELYTKVT